jgi:type I restriction enzyme S subunit
MVIYPAYSQYSSDGFPDSWEKKRLRFALKMNPSKGEIELDDSDTVSFVPMDAVGEYGGIRLSEEKELSEIGSGYTYFCDDDVVVAKITPCFENGKGAVAKGLTNKTAFGTTELHVMRASLGQLDPSFLFYLTISDLFRKMGESEMYGAGGQKRVPESFFKDFRAGLPSFEEQQFIARFLDFKTAQIDALIAKKKELLNKLADKRTALISLAVTKGLDPSVPMKHSGVAWLGNVPAHWKVIPIKFSLDMPITDGPHSTPQFYDDGIPFLSAESVKNDRLDFARMRGYISEDDHAAFSKKYKPKFGDVYMVKSGATTGAVARVETHDDFNIWSPLAVLRPHTEKSITDYLFYVLKSKPFFYSVELSWSYGTQQNIGMGVISNIRMALPPVEEQQQICQYLEPLLKKNEAQRAKIDSVVERLHEYRSALITNAVTGKIDVRGFEVPQTAEGIAS